MPHLPGQKGTGKKSRDARQSRSRNTTPSTTTSALPKQEDGATTAYLDLPVASFQTADDITDLYSNAIPSSQELDALLDRLNSLVQVVEDRGAICDRGMRLLAQARKERLEEIETERRDEEHKERLKRDLADEEERGRSKANKIKKRKDASTAREERPLTHGAHVLAPQDGSNLEQPSPSKDKKPSRRASRDNDSASSSLSPPAVATPITAGIEVDEKDRDKDDDDDSSMDEHQPPPAPAIPHLQTFGDDPSTFPDPTVYEIRKDTSGLSREELMEIYSVAYFPEHSLDDIIPGSPPDKDFSNAKPTNQVQANTFATYLEPYFRPFEENDIAFLRERGDRVTPFVTPRRGKRHYTEVWAEEDGALSMDPQHRSEKRPLNQPRGNIENMTDDVAETDAISTGPILSRLMALMRPEHRAPPSDEAPTTNGLTNGEANIHGEGNNDLDAILGVSSNSAPAPLPSATYMPESNSESWKKVTHPNLDYAQMDERIKLELRHIGFLPMDSEPDYDAHNDDDVAVRLRYLQAKLKEVAIQNGSRKARLYELVKEKMAQQEYTTILEDLDGQVQTAYLKRTRTLGKSKKTKRPGGAGGGSHYVGSNGANSGMARPGIGDMTKTLMERRRKWIDTIGGVLDPEASKVRRQRDPDSSIFKAGEMAEFVKKENQAWDEDAEEE